MKSWDLTEVGGRFDFPEVVAKGTEMCIMNYLRLAHGKSGDVRRGIPEFHFIFIDQLWERVSK